MDFQSLVESNVSKQVDKLFGDKDEKLKLIAKLDLLNDNTEQSKLDREKVIQQMRRSNEIEAMLIEQELYYTLDTNGNLIEIERN